LVAFLVCGGTDVETEKRFLTLRGAANFCSLSESTIRRLLNNNRLTRCGAPGIDAVLIDRNELTSLLRGEAAGSAG
jgi:hypothetical protein